MTKVFNSKLTNTKVVFSFGEVYFDENGISDITPDENANLALGVKGYCIADENLLKSIEDSKGKLNKEVEPSVRDAEKAKAIAMSMEPIMPDFIKPEDTVIMEDGKAIEDMTHSELDQLAEQLDVESYPKKATKDKKIDAIGEAIDSKAK